MTTAKETMTKQKSTEVHNLKVELNRERLAKRRCSVSVRGAKAALLEIGQDLAALELDVETGAVLSGKGYSCSDCGSNYNYCFNFCPDCGHDHRGSGGGYAPGTYEKIIKNARRELTPEILRLI